jgi:hypothetical protein
MEYPLNDSPLNKPNMENVGPLDRPLNKYAEYKAFSLRTKFVANNLDSIPAGYDNDGGTKTLPYHPAALVCMAIESYTLVLLGCTTLHTDIVAIFASP